jgi:adenine-specific DNA-methyltransferase
MLHPFQRRLLAEDFVRLRRADERRRYASSQRHGRIDPNPHQIDAVVFALKRIPEGGCILADEVGLGKTIEAGLIIAQLLAEGMRRILLIVPKSLVGQWQTELYSLFGIEAHEGRLDPEAFSGDGVFLVHRDFAGGPKGSSLLRAADPFELVVIDEAHEVFANIYKRFDKDGNYRDDSDEAQMADRVRSLLKPTATPVLLLTATPIQNSLAELWGLVQYVEPLGVLLGKLPTFREVFCEDGGRKLAADQAFELRRRLGSVLQRTLRRQAQEFLEVPFVERRAKLIEVSMSPEEKELYNDVTAWLMHPYLCSFNVKSRRLLLIGFHRRMASSLVALRSSLDKVARRLQVQLEGAGGGSWSDLAKEFAQDFEEELQDFEEPEDDEPTEPPSHHRLRAELERVKGFITRAKGILRETKAVCLLEVLKVVRERGAKGDGTGKVVVFTESLQTQDFLYDFLTTNENSYRPEDVTLFRGDNELPRAREALGRWEAEVGRAIPSGNAPSRQVAIRLALVHEFEKRSKVFIATEAGAKGLNLQFCENLINYDLPWNPQRIEQRIGRVHRYKQKRPVTIFSFIDRANEAQRLTFEILSQKLDLFGKVLGESDAVLHSPSSEFPEPLVSGLAADFESQLRSIYAQARSIDEVAQQLRILRDSIEVKRQEFDAEQARAVELIRTRFDNSVRNVFLGYKEELPASLEELDHDLDLVIGNYLKSAGVVAERNESSGRITYKISPSPHLPAAYRNGGTFLVGHAHDLSQGEPLHPGHPLVWAAVEEARQATSEPLPVVELVASGTPLSEILSSHIGRRGRLIVTKVSYRGLESFDHLLVTALLEGQNAPLVGLTVESLLALSLRNAMLSEAPLALNQALLNDAIEEAVLEDQAASTSKDQDRFNRNLEQLDRYLDDQILVLQRKCSSLERNLEAMKNRKEKAAAPSLLTPLDRNIHSLEREMFRLEERIERLRDGEDPNYQQWRDRLYHRRFQRPVVEHVLEVDFKVVGGDITC